MPRGEHTQVANGSDAYAEQLVRLQGQAIWYTKYPLPAPLEPDARRSARVSVGLPADGVVYMCLHSTFKFQPSFDRVLGDILRRVPNSVVAVTEGRQTAWTQAVSTAGCSASTRVCLIVCVCVCVRVSVRVRSPRAAAQKVAAFHP